MTKTKTTQQTKGAVEPLRPQQAAQRINRARNPPCKESSLKSKSNMAAARLCRWTSTSMPESKAYRPARYRSISPWAALVSREAESPSFSAPNHQAKQRWPCTSSPTPRKQAASRRFIDAEHALDTTWAKRLGVDVSSLLVSQPDNGEQALDIAEMLIASNSVDVLVIDSVAALTPKAEIEGEMGDSHMGLQARLMSQAMRKLTAIIARSKTALIFINQIRMKIGVMFGNPETTTGGNALKFYSSVRLDLRRITTLKEESGSVGNRVRARVVKNKIAPPFREAEFDIMFDHGISYEGDLLDLGVACNVIEKSGTHLGFGEIRLGQGREKARQFLIDNKDLCEQIKHKILVAKGLVEEK